MRESSRKPCLVRDGEKEHGNTRISMFTACSRFTMALYCDWKAGLSPQVEPSGEAPTPFGVRRSDVRCQSPSWFDTSSRRLRLLVYFSLISQRLDALRYQHVIQREDGSASSRCHLNRRRRKRSSCRPLGARPRAVLQWPCSRWSRRYWSHGHRCARYSWRRTAGACRW